LRSAPGPRREWFVEIQVERSELPLPCSLHVFLGDQLVGSMWLLNMPKTGFVYDELSLSRAIDHLNIGQKKPEVIERKLMADIRVKVTQVCDDQANVMLELVA
jgi:tyrosinase